MSSISQAHSDAARPNPAKSHGPTTPEGKARSSQNSRTHGLTASRIIFNTPEECGEFDTLRADYEANVAPKGPIERDLAEQMIHATWRLRNIAVADAALYEKAGGDPLLSDDPAIEKKAALLHRYRIAAERSFQRALKQLETLQNNRLYQEQFPKLVPPDGPPLANAERFSSRSQANLGASIDDAIEQAESEAKTFDKIMKDMLTQFPKS